ncbi:DUF5753 domain-containing protein [Spirillospora sp. CA-294931]|uniref:DUF5753 domain-containing protein n=1 Tax=Spirillospora sp. CA-294931 TaxID=3240042 RepID=UPI003D9273D6
MDVVPGLLQIPEYATCLAGVGGSEVDARLLEMRTTRQQVLDRSDPPQYDVILTEAVLRHQMGGPEAMQAQLRHLTELSARNHVHLQVIPFTAGPHRGLAKPFTLLNVGQQGNLTITALESRIGLDFEERDDKIRLFEEIFADLQIIALPEDETRSFIKRLSSEP